MRANRNSSSRGPDPHAASGPHSTSMRAILVLPSGEVPYPDCAEQPRKRPIRSRFHGGDHGPGIPHTVRAACSGPSGPTIRRSGASGAFPSAAREAEVTSQPGPVSGRAVPESANPDVVLVGGGIMSATLAALLGVVAPHWSVAVFESAADGAGESSGRWNNAGTGPSALSNLTHTPAGPDGRVDPAKAV